MSNKESFWNNQWVVGIGLLAIPTVVIWITGFFTSFWNFITQTAEVPYWALFMTFFAGIMLIVIIRAKAKKESTEIEFDDLWFLDYTEERFGNVVYKWRWRKQMNGYAMSGITQHCGNCGCMIVSMNCPQCHQRYNYSDFKSLQDIEAIVLNKCDQKDKSLRSIRQKSM